MILKEIEFKNFLSHENTKLNIPLGVTVIVGPNGAGKTAIMDAVMHSLLGFRGVRSRASNVDDLIRFGAKSMELELKFESDGKEYTVHWRRDKGRDVDVRLQCKGLGLITTSITKTVQEITRILDIDKDILLSSVFIRQGEITSLIEEEPSKRKELIGRILGLDRFQKTYDRIIELKRFMDDKKVGYEKEIMGLNGRLKELRRNAENLSQKINSRQKDINELNSKIQFVESDYKRISLEKELLDSMEIKYNELYKKLIKLEAESKGIENIIRDLKNELNNCINAREKLKTIEDEVKKVQYLESYIKINDEWEKCNMQIKELNEQLIVIKEIGNLEENLKNLLKIVTQHLPQPTSEALRLELELLESKLNEIQNNITDRSRVRDEFNGGIKKLSEDVERIDSLDVCPLCRTKLTPQHKENVRLEVSIEIQKLEKGVKDVEAELESLMKIKMEIESKIRILRGLSDKVKEIELTNNSIIKRREEVLRRRPELENINFDIEKTKIIIEDSHRNLEVKINEYKSEINNLINILGYKPINPRKELEHFKGLYDEYNRLKFTAERYDELIKRLNNNEMKLNEIKMEIDGTLKLINELNYDHEKHDKIKLEHNRILAEYSQLKGRLKGLQEAMEKDKESLDICRRSIIEIEDEINKQNILKEKVENAAKIIEVIRGIFSKDGIQKLWRQRLTPLISQLATKYIDQFNLDITGISVDEDLEVKVSRGGNLIPTQLLSGGERVAVAIALRLALARVLASKFSTIIMDEPTIHLDEERRKVLIDVFKSFRESTITQQMIIITHDRELEEVADTIYQVEKVNDVSRVKEIKY